VSTIGILWKKKRKRKYYVQPLNLGHDARGAAAQEQGMQLGLSVSLKSQPAAAASLFFLLSAIASRQREALVGGESNRGAAAIAGE
jgi:hypothetical protein